MEVTVAGLPCNEPIKCSRDVVIKPDTSTCDAISKAPYDAIILPGGLGGAKAQCESAVLGKLLKEQEQAGRIVAAICAGIYQKTSICIYQIDLDVKKNVDLQIGIFSSSIKKQNLSSYMTVFMCGLFYQMTLKVKKVLQVFPKF